MSLIGLFNDNFSEPFFNESLFRIVPDSKQKNNITRTRMDVTETEKGYVIHADLPGLKKEDVGTKRYERRIKRSQIYQGKKLWTLFKILSPSGIIT